MYVFYNYKPIPYVFLLTCPHALVVLWPVLCYSGLQVQSLFWSCDGESLILLGKDQLCVCYMATDEEKWVPRKSQMRHYTSTSVLICFKNNCSLQQLLKADNLMCYGFRGNHIERHTFARMQYLAKSLHSLYGVLFCIFLAYTQKIIRVVIFSYCVVVIFKHFSN